MPDLNKWILFSAALLGCFYPAYSHSETIQQLPLTDGYGLLSKPPSLSKAVSEKMFEEGQRLCQQQCVTPFGRKLGQVDGVVGYSNCQSACIHPQYSFLNLQTGEVTLHQQDPQKKNLHYIGVIYQCVEYSRRWWMINKDITYGSVDSAHEIIYLSEAKNIRTGEKIPLGRSINGTAKRPPQRGDLVIYYPEQDNPKWRHGHVAVIVGVDLKAGIVSLAEENYNNMLWQNPDAYSRQIRLYKIGKRYTLLDVSVGKTNNSEGARIAGWVYPILK